MKKPAAVVICSIVTLAGAALAHNGLTKPELKAPPPPSEMAAGPLEPLNYFAGDWEIEADWSWGGTLVARNEYRVGLAGKFMEVTTIASDDGGDPYVRYQSFYTYDAAEKKHVALGMTYDGTVSSLEHTLEMNDDGYPRLAFDNENPDGSRLRQVVEGLDDDRISWKVWMTPPTGGEGMQVMDGVWERVGAEGNG